MLPLRGQQLRNTWRQCRAQVEFLQPFPHAGSGVLEAATGQLSGDRECVSCHPSRDTEQRSSTGLSSAPGQGELDRCGGLGGSHSLSIWSSPYLLAGTVSQGTLNAGKEMEWHLPPQISLGIRGQPASVPGKQSGQVNGGTLQPALDRRLSPCKRLPDPVTTSSPRLSKGLPAKHPADNQCLSATFADALGARPEGCVTLG